MPKKSRSRSIYESLHPEDQRQVDISTGRAEGIYFGREWPRKSFDEAVKDQAGQPGSYTTAPGDIIRRRRKK